MKFDQRTTVPFVYVVVLLFVPANAGADLVLFTQSGDDLVMTIDTDLVFESIVTVTDGFFGVTFENVYSFDPLQVGVDFLDPPMVVIDGVANNKSTLFQGTAGGDVTLRDISFSLQDYFPNGGGSEVTITPGELLTVPAGQYVAPGYMSAGGTLPDLPVTRAYFWSRGGIRASATIVPEPSSTVLIAAMTSIGMVLRTRRNPCG